MGTVDLEAEPGDGGGDGDGTPTRATGARGRDRLATDTVVRHLEQIIFGGEVEPGDSLPSESELSADLGVSRLTVREGVRTLQARALIEVSHGRRPVVAHPNAAPLHDFFSAAVRRDPRGLLELLEVRLAIEVHTAQLAARNATRADISALEAALEGMRLGVDDEVAFNAADVRFHAAIAAASGNRMLSFIVEGMEEPLHTSRIASIRGYRAQSADLGALIQLHQAIFDCISERDTAGAAASMRKHLIGTRNDLRAAFALQPTPMGLTDPS
ncbi:FadR/GntR family transcriptional regulator [Cellulomonas timonensis]|uniref:FadR/GntR family transcriptional regulator n=1 Tax=Cellulomonas timonensis TaxID=1689271 RepID=UPI00131C7C41|nr:FadR/GntR family transcriptional regulator [Cellulomonas timonensis]